MPSMLLLHWPLPRKWNQKIASLAMSHAIDIVTRRVCYFVSNSDGVMLILVNHLKCLMPQNMIGQALINLIGSFGYNHTR